MSISNVGMLLQVVEKNDRICYELQSFSDKTCTVTVEEVLGHVLEQLAGEFF